MPTNKTLMGKPFEYSGSLATGVTVFFKPPSRKIITSSMIRIIKAEITKRSPVLMGACVKPLVADSIGETIAVEHNETPQVMSYILPLLVEDGFCSVSDRRPFVIHKR